MALDYQLVLSTQSSISALLKAVRQTSGLARSEDHTFLAETGVQISAITCGRSRRMTIEESFGFRPDAEIYFRLAKEADERQAGCQMMLAVVSRLLQMETGQAILLFNGETILLQRLGTELLLNLDWQTWQKEGRELITLPYAMQSLPSPLL